MIDSKTVRGGEARGEHASMRLLLQGFPAREMRFGGGTGGRMSCCTSTTVLTAAIEMWPARRRSSHAESASLAQRHHSTYSGSLEEAALQAEQCQMAGGGQKEYSSATTGERSALRLASPREQKGPFDSSRSTTSFAYHRLAAGRHSTKVHTCF